MGVSKRQIRTGETVTNKYGTSMKIIEYDNSNHVTIEFDDIQRSTRKVTYGIFKRGNLTSPFDKTVYDTGYIGVGKYKPSAYYKHSRQYAYWTGMLSRCYNNKRLINRPTYINCQVADEWHNFQNFAEWFDENYYELKDEKIALDKDILIKNNKIYSPNTCVFVPASINSLFAKSNNIRGKYPIGVHAFYGKYCSQCCNFNNKTTHLGLYNSPKQAFNEYKKFKESLLKEIAERYKPKIPLKLYNALYNYEVDIKD